MESRIWVLNHGADKTHADYRWTLVLKQWFLYYLNWEASEKMALMDDDQGCVAVERPRPKCP